MTPEHLVWDADDPDIRTDTRRLPRRLYHYTSAAGFAGIVESGGYLRATHNRFVNDAGEVEFGFRIALSVLDELKQTPPAVKRLAREYIHAVSANEYFLACFSKRRDLLSQWRAYADNGAGYCIGFEPKSCERTDTSHWWECIYGRPAVEKCLRERFARKAKRFEGTRYSNLKEVLAQQLAEVAWRYAHVAKHEHFREEREWRLSVIDEAKFYVSARGLASYVPTGKMAIKEVWVGPAVRPGPESGIRIAEQFLATHEIVAKVACWESPAR